MQKRMEKILRIESDGYDLIPIVCSADGELVIRTPYNEKIKTIYLVDDESYREFVELTDEV